MRDSVDHAADSFQYSTAATLDVICIKALVRGCWEKRWILRRRLSRSYVSSVWFEWIESLIASFEFKLDNENYKFVTIAWHADAAIAWIADIRL